MTLRERLEHELEQCRQLRAESRDRGVRAASGYIERRLVQLERHFARHAFGWAAPTTYRAGLRVVPPIWGDHCVDRIAAVAVRRFPRARSFHGLIEICADLNAVARRIALEFGAVPPVLAPRAIAWKIDLQSLPADPVRARSGQRPEGGRLADAAGPKRIWPMHRPSGCGYF